MIELAIESGGHRQSHRIAKVEGLLLAAAHSITSEKRLDEASAKTLVDSLMASNQPEMDEDDRSETNDAKQCLRHLLLWEIDVVKEIRSGGYDRRERAKITVAKACENYMRPGAYDLDEVDTELKKHGLMVKDYQGKPCLLVGPSHQGVKAIYRQTSWRDPRETLKRGGADGQPTGVQSFGGRQFRMKALAFPLEELIDIKDVAKPKAENMTTQQKVEAVNNALKNNRAA